jgi:hypothetical protein
MLKATKPEIIEKRLKLMVYGPAGVGKTTAAIQFPNAYIIDTEKGSDFYSRTISKAGSAVLKTNNPDEVKEQLQSLLTEKHQYKTLIIDPITQIYNATQEKWSRIFEKHTDNSKNRDLQDFGPRYWGRVKSDFKAIQRLMMALDMNVIVTSHQKDIYGSGMTKIGVGPDTMKGDEYIFDLVFELKKVGNKRLATTVKERSEIGENKFPEEFEWNYENFRKFYGSKIIEKESTPIVMASFEQVVEVKKLLGIVKIEDETVLKWFNRADVENWEEMTNSQIQGCIDFLKKKISSAE